LGGTSKASGRFYRFPNLYQFIKLEEDLGIELLEDDIGLTKNEFIQLASDDIYQNDFLRRKFTDILTNRLTVTY
jgi:hypothetical protein